MAGKVKLRSSAEILGFVQGRERSREAVLAAVIQSSQQAQLMNDENDEQASLAHLLKSSEIVLFSVSFRGWNN